MLSEDDSVSPGIKGAVELLLLIIGLLLSRLGLNSRNSSKPPSSDPNRVKKKRVPSGKKPGGQFGHTGTTLQQDPEPDHIEHIAVDKTRLPAGKYKDIGYESRQVIDLDITRVVTEYRAQILEDAGGNKYVAPFPTGITRPVQYGVTVKAHAIFLSQYQLIPYNRIEEHFQDQAGIPISAGSICNFNQEAYEKLEAFEDIVRKKLIESYLCHADETGININSKRLWLHCVSNEWWTYFYPHERRGFEAMVAMGVLPGFKQVLCHDHWKPYFKFDCIHALCNAHHLRELERAVEEDKQEWAKEVKTLLLEINKAVDDAGGQLSPEDSINYRQKYRQLLQEGQKECPPPDESQKNGKRGRMKRSRARNLLERLVAFETETLRFMDDKNVPFSNNQGENDIRMTKVQQKISGCFRSMKGAMIFCRIRSYLSTCKKHGVTASEALTLLLEGKLPAFLSE
jgi:transposase